MPHSFRFVLVLVAGCGSTTISAVDGGDKPTIDGGGDDIDGSMDDIDAGDDIDAAPNDDLAAALQALAQGCDDKLGGDYATDQGDQENIPVCGLPGGGVFWEADFDIDCDGKPSDVCNERTDGSFQPQTSAVDSNGEFLDASVLPYVVIPQASGRWNYEDEDIELGQVIAVIHDGKLEFGVFGDTGPVGIIGEASYAMADRVGVDHDPSTGGAGRPVTFIVFTGEENRVNTMEDHDEAVAIGMAAAAALIEANP